MIQSMTGFAEKYFESQTFSMKITIKSLNHRFLDWNFRAGQLSELESRLRGLCQKTLSRGRIEVFIDVQFTDPARWEVRINEELLAKLIASLEHVSGRLKRDVSFSVDHIFGIPHVIEMKRKNLTTGEVDFIEKCFTKTLKDLVRMRQDEGRRMKNEILIHSRVLRQAVREIEKLGKKQPLLIRNKLRDRLKELGQEARIPEEKFIEETAYMAQRYDLSEEIARLKSHILYMQELLSSKTKEPVGKKLDFVAQELFREANTINSKAQDIIIIQKSLTVKGELESIRQQVQNLE
ncbi:MAG: YicC/YloC family endoribonuclease [Candidatus Aminicenantaceae bacterium]